MNKFLQCGVILVLATFALAQFGCTSDGLDDGSGPDVILQVQSLENSPVTAEEADDGGGCTLTFVDWAATLKNRPKNSLATGPFNDIILLNVVIAYDWIDPALNDSVSLPIGLGNIVIEADASTTVTFAPLTFDDLQAQPELEGSTGNLSLTFNAVTVEGSALSQTVSRQLFVEACP